MKISQIEKLLNGIIKKFIDEIKPPNDVKKAIENGFITGGCIPTMIEGGYVPDYDFYFQSEKDSKVFADYIRKQHKNKISFDSENAITLDNKLQFIIKFTGKPDDIVKTFDFEHLKSYLPVYGKLKYNNDVFRLILEKELIYTGSHFPLASLLRTRKYIKRGWTITAKEMLKIVFDVHTTLLSISTNNNNNENVEQIKEKTLDFDFQNDNTPLNPETELQKNNLQNDIHISVDDFIEQMNGIDPLIIQEQLKNVSGEYISIKEIIDKIS